MQCPCLNIMFSLVAFSCKNAFSYVGGILYCRSNQRSGKARLFNLFFFPRYAEGMLLEFHSLLRYQQLYLFLKGIFHYSNKKTIIITAMNRKITKIKGCVFTLPTPSRHIGICITSDSCAIFRRSFPTTVVCIRLKAV